MNSSHVNVITHLHTYASNGPASSLDHTVNKILTDVFGSVPEGLIWRECFIDIADIRNILAGNSSKRDIGIIFLTDHMSSRYHKLDKDLLRLATEERRIGLGCEIQTVGFSRRQGRFVASPEVLLYGNGNDREFAGKKYTGIDDAMIAELYRECAVIDATEPEILKVNAFCRKNNIAFALAHPFDCQELDLEETLDVVAAFPFVEAVNGGFPHRSSGALQEYVAFHNEIIRNGVSSYNVDGLSESQKRRIDKISRSGILVPLGGSDAHFNNFDRVVTRFSSAPGKTMAADFVNAMLHCSNMDIIERKKMEPVGRGCSMLGLYMDVFGIVCKNIHVHRGHFRRPCIWPKLIKTLLTTGLRELSVRIRRNRSIAADFQKRMNIKAVNKAISRRKMRNVRPENAFLPNSSVVQKK